jgi:hypothetical protein
VLQALHFTALLPRPASTINHQHAPKPTKANTPTHRITSHTHTQENKELAKALGIKVAPTFHLYRNGEKVADMTGACVCV